MIFVCKVYHDDMLYHLIFFTNVLRVLESRGMHKNELAKLTGISPAFLSDLTNGKTNPSLKTMERIAEALEVSLPWLLESTDLDHQSLVVLSGGKHHGSLPEGYERITVVLPAQKAYIVKQWDADAKKKLHDLVEPRSRAG